MKQFLLIALLFLSFNIYSQYSYFSKPEIKSLEKKIKEKIDFQKTLLTDNNKKKKKKVLKNRSTYVRGILADSLFIRHEKLENHLSKIVNNICQSNPKIDKSQLTFFLRHNHHPNAASYGFNLFEINLGLFILLESEDEMAYIICHEIAHQHLNHLERSIENDLNNKEEIKKLRKGRSTMNMQLLKQLIVKDRHISKEYEIEADSLGMAYFKNTSYNKKAAFSALSKLGRLEEHTYSQPIQWKKNFGFDYNKLRKDNTLVDERAIDSEFLIESDSIRSHPHIKLRIAKINGTLDTVVNLKKHNEIQVSAIHTYLSYAEKHKLIVSAFYLNNVLFEMFPKNPDYKNNFIKLIDQIYILKKQHQIGKYVGYPYSYSEEKYLNEIIHFIHEIELFELKKIKLHLK